ncbi:MAG: leucine-rich repeat domain-containing protein [Clostridia bacterium]|nr:leucine-rich repeat domain-containing protein [Clostridia bacterium]
MRKTLLIFSLLLLCLFSSCVEESPEPVYIPETVSPEERKLLRTETINDITYGIYNDNTAELLEIAPWDLGDTLILPEKIGNHTLVAIGKEVFLSSSFKEITLPGTVIFIGERAFQKSSIEKITLPDSVTKIGKEAFDNCLYLNEVSFGKGLKEIPLGCFFGCSSLTEIHLPEGVESIGEEAFASLSALKSLSLPSSLKEIDAYAFWNSGAFPLSVNIPNGIISIGEEAFAGKHSHTFRYSGENVEVKNALGLNS